MRQGLEVGSGGCGSTPARVESRVRVGAPLAPTQGRAANPALFIFSATLRPAWRPLSKSPGAV